MSNIEISSLKKKQVAGQMDLMRPGNGTPWEDRGSIGPVPGYFKTVVKSMFSPGLLMDHISRPETTRDANAFALVSAAMWGLGVLLYKAYFLYMVFPAMQDAGWELVDPSYFYIKAFATAVLVAGGIYLWTRLGSQMYRRLGEMELKTASPSLVFDCFAYATGPSLLALVPIFGWGVAFCWIVFNQIVAGHKRLYMKSGSAIINPILIAVCVLAIAVVAYFALGWLWNSAMAMNPFEPPPPPKVHGMR